MVVFPFKELNYNVQISRDQNGFSMFRYVSQRVFVVAMVPNAISNNISIIS
jgi:hypothetical protein